tara:strand:+ start:264 stop:902 length:639 start_codon:yes stop_codon:yes gene_type:complete
MIKRTNKAFTEGDINISFNIPLEFFEELEERKILKFEKEQITQKKITFVGLGIESCSLIGKIAMGHTNKDGWYVVGIEPDDPNRSEIIWSSKIINDRAYDLDGIYDIASKPRVDRYGNSCRRSCLFVVFLENNDEEEISQIVNSLYEIIEEGDIILDKNNETMIVKKEIKLEIPFSVLRLLINDEPNEKELPSSAFDGTYGREVKPIIIASR